VKKPARNLPDTNTIVRYLIADDPVLHGKAKEFFDRVKHDDAKAVIINIRRSHDIRRDKRIKGKIERLCG